MLSCPLYQILTLQSKNNSLIRPGHIFAISCCLVLVSPCELFSVFSWVPPSVDLCCSSPSGWECYTCRDAVLHTFVVMSVLFFQLLPASSLQSAHSLLPSDINKALSPRELSLIGYSLLLKSCYLNLRDHQFLKCPELFAWHQQPCHVQGHLNHLPSQFW